MKKAAFILIDKYIFVVMAISMMVAILIHFPEFISLFDYLEMNMLFPGMKTADIISEVFFNFFSLLFLFWANTVLFHFDNRRKKITWKIVIFSFIFTWILSNMLGACFVFLHHTLHIPAIDATIHNYLHPLRDFIISCIVTGSCYILYLTRQQQQFLMENQQLQAENNLNLYNALKNQLNPHMLFNSLNTLRSLVREDPEKAQEYILELSRVLRYTLQGNESQIVTLREEMKFVSAYIFLLKMRYEENLEFNISIDKELEEYYLPPMTVQMLIENAVKHNEISSRRPLIISIFTDKERGISVSNPIQEKMTPTSGIGVGLANLSKRVQLLFHQEIQINEDACFTVRVPLIHK
ncbi:MAG: histidine kinase [Bacteroidales bacterium]|nr:histidine kinase [Bacteroidales bacterium]